MRGIAIQLATQIRLGTPDTSAHGKLYGILYGIPYKRGDR